MPHKQSPIDVVQLLRQAGMRATPGRCALLEVLAAEPKPLTVQQLEARLDHSLNYVTLYRALEALAAAGIVVRSDLGHDHAHYELVAGRAHHHHVVCTTCGFIEDIEVPHPSAPEHDAARHARHFAHIHRYTLEFFGHCHTCATQP